MKRVACWLSNFDPKDALGLVGLVALGVGVGMMNVPIALIVVGVVLLAISLAGSLR